MSDEELIGTWGRQYRDAKRRLAILQTEARRWSDFFSALGQHLGELANDRIEQPNMKAITHMPTPQNLEKLMSDIGKAATEINSARRELAKLDIDVE